MSEQSTAIPKAQSQFGAVWQKFRVRRGAVFGLIVLGRLAAFVIFGPLFWPEVKLKVVEALKVKNQGPSLRFPFGTDQLGRDMMVRMMAAGKVSLAVGFVAMIIAIFVGTGIGILAGYFKRRKLIANQVIEKELADDGLLISAKVGHQNQVLPIIRYWIPHIRIISPDSWQQDLEQGIRDYLQRNAD